MNRLPLVPHGGHCTTLTRLSRFAKRCGRNLSALVPLSPLVIIFHAFNPVEFDGIRKQAGLNSFTLTPKQWIEKTGAIGIISKAGRYGGTYAHKDIAFEFASWISVEFKLYLIKEFQRSKKQERKTLGSGPSGLVALRSNAQTEGVAAF